MKNEAMVENHGNYAIQKFKYLKFEYAASAFLINYVSSEVLPGTQYCNDLKQLRSPADIGLQAQ